MRGTIYYKWFTDELKATHKMKDFREMSINQQNEWYIQWLESKYEDKKQLIDRYIWLLSHMGLVEEEAKRWNPETDRPLLIHLATFVDREMQKSGSEFIEQQRKLLREYE